MKKPREKSDLSQSPIDFSNAVSSIDMYFNGDLETKAKDTNEEEPISICGIRAYPIKEERENTQDVFRLSWIPTRKKGWGYYYCNSEVFDKLRAEPCVVQDDWTTLKMGDYVQVSGVLLDGFHPHFELNSSRLDVKSHWLNQIWYIQGLVYDDGKIQELHLVQVSNRTEGYGDYHGMLENHRNSSRSIDKVLSVKKDKGDYKSVRVEADFFEKYVSKVVALPCETPDQVKTGVGLIYESFWEEYMDLYLNGFVIGQYTNFDVFNKTSFFKEAGTVRQIIEDQNLKSYLLFVQQEIESEYEEKLNQNAQYEAARENQDQLSAQFGGTYSMSESDRNNLEAFEGDWELYEAWKNG